MNALDHLLESWRKDPIITKNITHWVTEEARPAVTVPFPDQLDDRLMRALERAGIESLYAHQAAAFEAIGRGKHVVIATGTASGKTLAFNLPVLNARLRDCQANALYLYPTKALAHDQLAGLEDLATQIEPLDDQAGSLFRLQAAVYDGDTPQHARGGIRKNAHLVLTNPDMLHTGILPHHTLWAEFFQHLRYVVVDEIHICRGVFGSHVANVLRRLRRIAAFYGAFPQFILTSATIGNPQELAERLVEADVELITQDGSPRGQRHFLMYNPPIVNADLGIRRSSLAESVRLSSDLLGYDIQTLIFARTRIATEIALKYLREDSSLVSSEMHGYRSGYLPQERRAIEQGLRSGRVRGVVATNALELGIDIGGVDASVLIGYPGTIAATRQQAGRAGRKVRSSMSVLVASANPLDQFLVQHPEFLYENSPEKALINPNNPLILLHHLRCAAFELPFRTGDSFGALPWEQLEMYLSVLEEGAELYQSADRFFWTADRFPAEQISLRSTSAQTVLLQVGEHDHLTTIGEVDEPSAVWMVHPNAVYLHEARTYLVEALNLEDHRAILRPVDVDYYTEAQSKTEIQKLEVFKSEAIANGTKTLGEVMVTSRVVGFRKVRWHTHETLGSEPLDLPPTNLRTIACWLTIGDEAVDRLQASNLWTNAPNNYGPDWLDIRARVRERDRFTCQVCGAVEHNRAHDVHHITPFRQFTSAEQANRLENLITLCPSCHRLAETAVRMRSGLAGLRYVLNQLAPLFVMCDVNDLGALSDPQSPLSDGKPVVVIYDQAPAGIGLSETLYDITGDLLLHAHELVSTCACPDGCPSCVGAGGENGYGGKAETRALLAVLTGKELE